MAQHMKPAVSLIIFRWSGGKGKSLNRSSTRLYFIQNYEHQNMDSPDAPVNAVTDQSLYWSSDPVWPAGKPVGNNIFTKRRRRRLKMGM